MSTRLALWLFLSFAFAYFFSALLRGVTATLAPNFSAELGLSASHLGLLAGAFFGGFALTQLPLGSALDRYGPRRVHAGAAGRCGAGLRGLRLGAQLCRADGRRGP